MRSLNTIPGGGMACCAVTAVMLKTRLHGAPDPGTHATGGDVKFAGQVA
jgi:hypothetical protein